MNTKKDKSLYVGVGPYPIHQQHKDVMDELGGDWDYIDKYVDQPGTLKYDAFALPYLNGTIHAIYASHLLEHIAHTEIKGLLSHWYALLKNGGILYINVPDLEWACWTFLNVLLAERQGNQVTGYYNKSIDFDEHEHNFLQIFYGSQAHDGEYHKCGFTTESMIKLLKGIGFKNISIKKQFEAHEIGCLIVKAEK